MRNYKLVFWVEDEVGKKLHDPKQIGLSFSPEEIESSCEKALAEINSNESKQLLGALCRTNIGAQIEASLHLMRLTVVNYIFEQLFCLDENGERKILKKDLENKA